MSRASPDVPNECLKYGTHGAPGARCNLDDCRLPALFAIKDIGIPAGIFRTKVIAYLPGTIYFLLFVKSSIQAKPEGQELREVGLQPVLNGVCIKLMIGKRHLQIEAERIVHHFGIAVFLVSIVNQNKHAQQLELVIWLSRKEILFEWRDREEIACLCGKLWHRRVRSAMALKRHME